MATSYIYFGNAVAEYPRGSVRNWQIGIELRKRPEEDGADSIEFGNDPMPSVIQCVLFGATVAAVRAAVQKWIAEKGDIHTVRFTGATAGTGVGVMLLEIDDSAPIQRVLGATNSASYMMRIGLAFARVAETS